MFTSGTPGPLIYRSQQAFKRGYLVKKGDFVNVVVKRPSVQ